MVLLVLHLVHLLVQMKDQMKDQMLNLLLVRRIHHLVRPVLLLGHLLDRLDQIHLELLDHY